MYICSAENNYLLELLYNEKKIKSRKEYKNKYKNIKDILILKKS